MFVIVALRLRPVNGWLYFGVRGGGNTRWNVIALNGVRCRSSLVFFSLETNFHWFTMADGRLSLVTVGLLDQRPPLVNAITFQLLLIYKRLRDSGRL